MSLVIDRDVALALLTAAIYERGGDYVYKPLGSPGWSEQCVYAADGKPSCGVGVALSKAGVSIAELERLDRAGVEMGFVFSPSLYEVLSWGLTSVYVTRDGAYALEQFQKAQDRGTTWREAFLQAVRS
jgi:hypothetical protein